MKIHRFLIGLLAGACVFLASCGGDGSGGSAPVSDAPTRASHSHVLTADSGEWTPATSPDVSGSSGTLILKSPNAAALWFSADPSGDHGTTSPKDVVDSWDSHYADANPNATVQFQTAGSPDMEAIYLSLSQPSFDEKANTLTFQAQLQNHTLGKVGEGRIELSHVTVHALNNAVDQKEVESYVQYASLVELQPTAKADEFKLVMSKVGPDMLWADNAPGKHSEARPISYFAPQWPYMFNEAAPTAVLAGVNSRGEPALERLTLANPQYDEAAKQLTYTATRQGQSFGASETIHKAMLRVNAPTDTRFPIPGKGTGYQAFGGDYNPSTANTSYIYFGSDIARKQTASLWGKQSFLSQPCGSSCRNDLQRIKDMGINLVRLYDWDPRNDHSQFLDYANALHLKVIVPISNWLPTQAPNVWDEQLPNYFSPKNYANSAGNDWHPAIAGVIISNELDMDQGGQFYSNAVGLVARFLQEADARGFSKNIRVGIPISFVPRGAPLGPQGQGMPGWNQFDRFVNDPRTAPYKDRLMLCPQTYNLRNYLFSDAEGSGQGWVQLTYQQFNTPILFTEIGYSRANGSNAASVVLDQLQGVIEYQKQYPEQLLGAAHFQYDDKVWKQTPNDSDSEGAFGTFHHGATVLTIPTVQGDYDFYINEAGTNYGTLTVDQLVPTALLDAVVQAYK